MARACFFCRTQNEYICNGEHCGICPEHREVNTDVLVDGYPVYPVVDTY